VGPKNLEVKNWDKVSLTTISPEIGCPNPIFSGRFLVSFSAPGVFGGFGVSALDWDVPTRSFPLSVTTSPHDFIAIGGFGRVGTSQSNPIFFSKQPTVFPRVGRVTLWRAAALKLPRAPSWILCDSNIWTRKRRERGVRGAPIEIWDFEWRTAACLLFGGMFDSAPQPSTCP